MYSWPVFSAAVGITSNLIFVAIVCMVSWYQIINSNEYNQYAALNSFHKIQPFEEFEEGKGFVIKKKILFFSPQMDPHFFAFTKQQFLIKQNHE